MILFAYQTGVATRDDLLFMFMDPRKTIGYGVRVEFLYQFSGRRVNARLEAQLERFPSYKILWMPAASVF